MVVTNKESSEHRVVYQLADFVLWEHEVAGSSPVYPTPRRGYLIIIIYTFINLFLIREHIITFN